MENTKKCPFCGENILADAVKCRYCNEWISENKSYTAIKVIIISILFYILISLLFVIYAYMEGDFPPVKEIAETVFSLCFIGLLMGIAISRTVSTSSNTKMIKLGAVYGACVNIFLQIVYFRLHLAGSIAMVIFFTIVGAINGFIVSVILKRKSIVMPGDKKNEV